MANGTDDGHRPPSAAGREADGGATAPGTVAGTGRNIPSTSPRPGTRPSRLARQVAKPIA